MPVRRLNYTNRKRILRDHVRIVLDAPPGAAPAIRAELHLQSYDLPPDATVFLEARRQTRLMRFACGTVGSLRALAGVPLEKFVDSDGIVFRVVITAQNGRHGLILAEGDRIPPLRSDGDSERVSLLPVRGDDQLGQRIWRLDFTAGPLLLVNCAGGVDWRSLARDPRFRTLVWPSVVREVLQHVFDEGGADPESDDWKSQWLQFGGRLTPGAEIPDPEDQQAVAEWIDDAVVGFCTRHSAFDELKAIL
jgi:hypothetical protein